MRVRLLAVVCAWLVALPVQAQDLGPNVRKIRDGIYVYAAKPQDSNVSFIQTKEGVVMIDTGQTPVDALAAMGILKKLSAQPVRFVIHTEPHDDHTNGDFVFSPPAFPTSACSGPPRRWESSAIPISGLFSRSPIFSPPSSSCARSTRKS